MKLPVVNPYVGPRPFTRAEAGLYYGRDTEARDLLSLAVSEQLVLFYSQSGAGKSSLINARLVPGLEERNFEVLPVGRVSGDILKHEQCANIFIFNLLTHLDQSKGAPERFAQMRLADFLGNLAFDGELFLYADPANQPAATAAQEANPEEIKPRVLIIDQFEEIMSTHLEAWEKRQDLFAQIAEAMEQDPYLWVVLVMREDYVATLDPFAHLLPNQLRARYYMRRMESKAALEAVRKPVEKLRPYDPGIAEMLVDNLRMVSGTQILDGNPVLVQGEYIEPVQLQVVCFQLWSSLMKQSDTLSPGKHITLADIEALAKGESLAQFINKALGDFYEQALAKVLEKTPGLVSERDLRTWFSTQLITEAETRGFVYQGKTLTEGLPNEAVNVLASIYIIRPDNRPGGTWFELVHDRFVGPILQSNRAWMALHQSRLLTDAQNWNNGGKADAQLYEGKQLEAAQAEVQRRGSAVTEVEQQFVSASAKAFKRRRDRRNTLIWTGVVALIMVLVGLSGWAISSRNAAVQALSDAQAANQLAEMARDAAVSAQGTVVSQNATAQFQTTALVQQSINQVDSISRLQTQIAPLLNEPVSSSGSIPPTEAPGDLATPTRVQDPNTELTQIPPTATPPPATATAYVTERKFAIGKSVKGQELVVYQYGNGARHIVFVGGLHAAYSPSTVEVGQLLTSYLHSFSKRLSSAVTVDVIVNANPDSVTRQDLSGMVIGRNNANGVDLNFNWDCNWKQDALWSRIKVDGGTSAFSEPETQALREFILSNLSVAVIVFEAHEQLGGLVIPGGCGERSLFSQPLADEYAKVAGYNSSEYVAYAQTGAMIDWLDSQSIPAINVNLENLQDATKKDLEAQVLGMNAIISSFSQSAP